MFEELYEQIPDTGKFLERIGLKGFQSTNDLESLNKLIYSFKTHVPFENLEVWYERKIPSLAITELFDKVVNRKRGGYCHELNGLFWAFLRDIGFDVYSVSVYVKEDLPFLPDLAHRGNICTIDGRQYYVDVGYGGTSPYNAIPVDGEEAGGFFIRKEGKEYMIYMIVDEEKEIQKGNGFFVEKLQLNDGSTVTCKKMLMYRDFVAYPVEFTMPNIAIALDYRNMFNKNLVVNFKNPDGNIYSIFNNHFSGSDSSGSFERTIKNIPELKSILKEYFGIVI